MSACSTQFIIDSKQNSIISVSATPDSLITSIINPYKIGIDSVMNEVLCISEIEMTKGNPESVLGNFVTDLCLEQYSDSLSTAREFWADRLVTGGIDHSAAIRSAKSQGA